MQTYNGRNLNFRKFVDCIVSPPTTIASLYLTNDFIQLKYTQNLPKLTENYVSQKLCKLSIAFKNFCL